MHCIEPSRAAGIFVKRVKHPTVKRCGTTNGSRMWRAWEYAGEKADPLLHKEPLIFENVKLSQRSYK